MRELTQKEIDNAPEWATHYVINKGGLVIYECDFMWCAARSESANRHSGVDCDSKPIPRKQEEAFDISKYQFSEPDIIEVKQESDDKGSWLRAEISVCDSFFIERQDAVALAKHFKLTTEDLK